MFDMTNPLLSELAAEAHRLTGLGYMACTGGNLSVRLPDAELTVAVSVSGVDKGRLGAADFLIVGRDGAVRGADSRKPSDETFLHLRLYEATGCGAVCHGHPTYAVVLSLAGTEHLRFAGIEMQKAFAGTTTHDCERLLPVVDNHQDMRVLSERVLAARRIEVPAVVVRGHGVYAWGRTIREAGRHLETVEWLSRVQYLATR
jgi:methylthioribulose-1-phosphate dehydratase